MRGSLIAGILLIALGVFALAKGGFSWTEREKVIDVGPIEATATEKKTFPVSPVLGALAIAGGIALLVAGSRRSA